MALSGSLTTTAYSGRYYTLSWTATQDVGTNTSTVSWTLSCTGGTNNWYAERTLYVVINGKAVVNKTARVERYKGTIATGTTKITHNTDGTKSFSASVSAAVYGSSVNCTGSKNFTLNQIPRAAIITSADSFNDEQSPVLKYSNPAGTAVSSLQACIASTDGSTIYIPYRDIAISGTSYTFDFTDDERSSLRQLTMNTKSLEVKFYIKTVIGTNTFYSSLQKTLTIVNAEPHVSLVTWAEDSLTESLLGTDDGIILGISTIAYDVFRKGQKYAEITGQHITNGTATASTPFGSFPNATSATTTATVTDSRGNTTTVLHTVGTVVNYINPTANLRYSNVSVEGRVDLDFSGNYYSGNFGSTPNTLTIEYRYKPNDGDWTAYQTLADVSISNNTYSASYTLSGLDYRKSYTIEYRLTDKIKTITSNSVDINFVPLFDWGAEDFQFNIDTFWKNGNVGVRGITTDGEKVQSLIPCNSNNNMTIGYGLYSLGIGNTNIYGNGLHFISNNIPTLNGGSLYGEHVLFDNENGAAGAITLSQPASEFKYLEIYFEDNNLNGAGYTKVYNPDGKEVDLSIVEATPTDMTYIRRTSYSISDTTITPISMGYLNFGATTGTSVSVSTGTNYLRITRVVGIK